MKSVMRDHGRWGRFILRRKLLLRWGARFLVINIALALLIALGYLPVYQFPADAFVRAYIPVLMISHFTLLTTALWAVTFIPLLIIAPRPSLAVLGAAAAFGLGAAVLILDVNLFAENQYHLSALNIQILDTSTWALTGLFLVIGFAFEVLLGRSLVRGSRRRMPGGRAIAAVLATCTVSAQAVHVWADATYNVPLTSLDNVLPGFLPLTAQRLLTQYGLVNYNQVRERALSRQLGDVAKAPLVYPRRPLRCAGAGVKRDVFYIVIDTMRADVLNPEVMPRTEKIATGMDRFQEHSSGGIATGYGMFSLFYGLPGTYWTTITSNEVAPVLMRKFVASGYDIGAFSTHGLQKNALERTAFAGVKSVLAESSSVGATEWQRDESTIDQWEAWLKQRSAGQPIFAMLMLNSLSVYSAPPEFFASALAGKPGATELSRRERYLAVAGYVDQLIERTVSSLIKANKWQDSIVIITADHGEEFDDSGLGYWGHGKAYTRFQMHVPLLVHWPGREPKVYGHRTSHHDVTPTILEGLFGCTNEPSDYSSGKNLYSGQDWEWFLAGGYNTIALIEPDRVTTSYRGSFEVRDSTYRIIENPTLRRSVLAQALAESSAFYRQPGAALPR